MFGHRKGPSRPRAAGAVALVCGFVPGVLAQNPAIIKIKTRPATAIAPGFSGLNVPQPRNNYDPKFVAAVAPLRPGWLRFPGGTASLAYDWNLDELTYGRQSTAR